MEKFKEFWTDIFTAWNSEDSIAVLFFLGISFLLGLLFGRWSRGGKIKRLKKELEAKDTELKTLRTQYDTLVGQFEEKEEEIRQADVRFNEMSEDFNRITNERMHYQTELRSAKEQLDRLQQENLAYAAQVEGTTLNDNVNVNPVVSTNDEAIETAIDVNNDRLALIEEKLERLVLENANLKEEVASLERDAVSGSSAAVLAGGGAVVGGAVVAGGSTVTNPETGEAVLDLSDTQVDEAPSTYENEVNEEDAGDLSPQERAERAKGRIGAALGNKIPRANLSEKDDLKKIEGIGPFIEAKLNDVGIYTFEQVSMLDGELISLITDAIQFFPGRIEKDDWMGQAASYMG